MTILVEITKTAKGYHPSDERRVWDRTIQRFDTVADATRAVKEMYEGKRPRSPVFMDTKNRGTIKCGFIYSGKGEDQDRSAANGRYRYTWQDWVSFSRVISETDKTAESVDLDKEGR